jgi:hypothetical protein
VVDLAPDLLEDRSVGGQQRRADRLQRELDETRAKLVQERQEVQRLKDQVQELRAALSLRDTALRQLRHANKIARTMLDKPAMGRLCDFPRADPARFVFAADQRAYLDRLASWFGPDLEVVDYHTSKSCLFPLVRVGQCLLGYNCREYVAFLPLALMVSIEGPLRDFLAGAEMHWHPSFTEWQPGTEEVLLAGGEELVERLIAADVLKGGAP